MLRFLFLLADNVFRPCIREGFGAKLPTHAELERFGRGLLCLPHNSFYILLKTTQILQILLAWSSFNTASPPQSHERTLKNQYSRMAE